MKNVSILNFLSLSLSIFFLLITISCKNEDSSSDSGNSVLSGLIKIQEEANENHIITLYSKTGKIITGYNEIFLRIQNKTNGEFISGASISWKPLMRMTNKSHSCPYESIVHLSNEPTLYKGFILFQMANNDSEYWELELDYKIKNQNFKTSIKLTVLNSPNKVIQNFTGTDNNKYLLAWVSPISPTIGSNELTAYLYKMENMFTFTPVNNYKIIIDPRMPEMGNHGSPNNSDLINSELSGFYKGKISFTMTGYWKINLQVLDASGQAIKGESITETNSSSSIFWETEL
ncbi:FixH family protein [Apibacter raozihei]|uniref:FixH family protein n=1 Tax=Apibacter raozihei TaxID=2500547 RepID=UPI000FE36C2A|nr:FixH family protein [Apibacter raozihei]